MAGIDGPSLGDLTKPTGFDVMHTEGRRGIQRLADLEIPIIAAVNGPAPVHSEYALLADVVIASDTAVPGSAGPTAPDPVTTATVLPTRTA